MVRVVLWSYVYRAAISTHIYEGRFFESICNGKKKRGERSTFQDRFSHPV